MMWQNPTYGRKDARVIDVLGTMEVPENDLIKIRTFLILIWIRMWKDDTAAEEAS